MTEKAAAIDLAAIMAVLQDVKGGQAAILERVGVLEGQVKAQDAQIPRIVPMEASTPWDDGSPNDILARLGANGQVEGSLRSIPHDDMGRPLGDYAMELRPPTYHRGQTVRINPNSSRNGFPDGMTWAERLKKGRSDGVGKVTQILHQMRRGPWVYRIKVNGVGGHNGLLTVDDNELLPA